MTGLIEYNNSWQNKINNYILKHPNIEGFYNYLRIDKSLQTIYQYIITTQNFLDYSNKRPEDLTFNDFTKFLAKISVKEDGTPKTSSYIIQQYHSLKTYNTYLAETHILTYNYMLSIKRPKAIDSQTTLEKRTKSFLSKDEIKTYIEAVKSGVGTNRAKTFQHQMKERDYAIIMIFLTTGIRLSAMVKLDIDNVDFDKRILWVTDKGSKVKAYQLNETAIVAIKDWLKYRQYALKGNNTSALFVTKYGLRIKQDGITQIVHKYAVDINGKNITPHKLRATYGTQLYEATKDIYFVQKAMGHSSPIVTERYVRGQNDISRQASDIMASLI